MSVEAGTEVADLTDLEISLHEELPCDCPCGCDSPAHWRLTMRCCGFQGNYCRRCKANSVEMLWRLTRARLPFVCIHCDKVLEIADYQWRPL